MKRKKFVLLSAGIMATFALPAAWLFLRRFKYPSFFANPNSLKSILDSKDLHNLGASYCQQIPEESSEGAIASSLLKNSTSDAENKSFIENEIKKDFENGNTIEVDGWILSRTEARQCALFSLNTSK